MEITRMKEYVVFKIKCKSGLGISEIYDKIKQTVKFNSNFFELNELYQFRPNIIKPKIYEEINLGKYAFVKALEHLKKNTYYSPERDDRRLISNLDARWALANENENEPLNEDDFSKLIEFCDELSSTDILTLMLGFDEIEWNGNKVEKGTYGYEKAKSTFDLGKNYLSNSIIIGRTGADLGKRYTVYLSCEKNFKDLGVVNEIVDFLGEIKEENYYFAPENSMEREEWTRAYECASFKFENAVLELEKLNLEKITKKELSLDEQLFIEKNEKVNVRKHIKNYLCTDGWEIRKTLADECPIKVSKDKSDETISISIVSGHNGHHLQALLYYRSKKFLFTKHIHDLHCNMLLESSCEKYFENVKIIRDYLYEVL
jgi:hypothetical protein